MDLEDRLYSSTEVADILGVSLRSVYRYLEDGDLKAEVKTATGRHRFTRQDILNFLYRFCKSFYTKCTNFKNYLKASEGKKHTAGCSHHFKRTYERRAGGRNRLA